MEISTFLENLKTLIENGLLYNKDGTFISTNDVFNHRDHLKVYFHNGEEWVVRAERTFKDKITVVGEAPGRKGDKSAKPFIGRAGRAFKNLDKIDS